MAELAQAIRSNGSQTSDRVEQPRIALAPRVEARAPAVAEPTPSPSEERPPGLRARISELCASMVLAVLFAGLTLPLWATVGQFEDQSDPGASFTLSTVFFLTVATCWAVLVPAKLWSDRPGDSWTRRLVMLGLGGLVGLGSLWLSARWPDNSLASDVDGGAAGLHWLELGALTYFGIAFFALRWWRLADRNRRHRFSVAPVLAAGFWALMLLPLIKPHPWRSAVVIVMAAAIVQLVSPWKEPAQPATRKLRVRMA